jgi:hypothetical protein
MTKKQNEGWDDISKEDSSRKPITAWAVEIEGKIDPDFVFNNRATARHVRNTEASVGLYKRVSTRKVVIQVVDGR